VGVVELPRVQEQEPQRVPGQELPQVPEEVLEQEQPLVQVRELALALAQQHPWCCNKHRARAYPE
jgi:hypothetical protein